MFLSIIKRLNTSIIHKLEWKYSSRVRERAMTIPFIVRLNFCCGSILQLFMSFSFPNKVAWDDQGIYQTDPWLIVICDNGLYNLAIALSER